MKLNTENLLVITSQHTNGKVTQETFQRPIDWHKIKREIDRTRRFGSTLMMQGVAP